MKRLIPLALVLALLATAGSGFAAVEAIPEVAAFATLTAEESQEFAWSAGADAQAKAAAARGVAEFATAHPDQAYGARAGQALGATDNARAQAHAAEDMLFATTTYAAMHPGEVASGFVPSAPAPPALPTPEVVDAIAAGPIGTYQWAYGYLDGRVRGIVENIDSTPSPLTEFAGNLFADAQAKAVAVTQLASFLTANAGGVVDADVAFAAAIVDGSKSAAENLTDTAGSIVATGTVAVIGARAADLAGLVESCAGAGDPVTAAQCAQSSATAWLSHIVDS